MNPRIDTESINPSQSPEILLPELEWLRNTELFKGEVLREIIENSDYKPQDLIDLLCVSFREIYRKDVGVSERFTLEEHTRMTLETVERFLDENDFSESFTLGDFRFLLGIHDIGKPTAVEQGDKRLQHKYTVAICDEILPKLGFTEEKQKIIKALIKHDSIGTYLQCQLPLEKCVQQIRDTAQESGLSEERFIQLLMKYYMTDAFSYTNHAGGAIWSSLNNVITPSADGSKVIFTPQYQVRIDELLSILQHNHEEKEVKSERAQLKPEVILDKLRNSFGRYYELDSGTPKGVDIQTHILQGLGVLESKLYTPYNFQEYNNNGEFSIADYQLLFVCKTLAVSLKSIGTLPDGVESADDIFPALIRMCGSEFNLSSDKQKLLLAIGNNDRIYNFIDHKIDPNETNETRKETRDAYKAGVCEEMVHLAEISGINAKRVFFEAQRDLSLHQLYNSKPQEVPDFIDGKNIMYSTNCEFKYFNSKINEKENIIKMSFNERRELGGVYENIGISYETFLEKLYSPENKMKTATHMIHLLAERFSQQPVVLQEQGNSLIHHNKKTFSYSLDLETYENQNIQTLEDMLISFKNPPRDLVVRLFKSVIYDTRKEFHFIVSSYQNYLSKKYPDRFAFTTRFVLDDEMCDQIIDDFWNPDIGLASFFPEDIQFFQDDANKTVFSFSGFRESLIRLRKDILDYFTNLKNSGQDHVKVYRYMTLMETGINSHDGLGTSYSYNPLYITDFFSKERALKYKGFDYATVSIMCNVPLSSIHWANELQRSLWLYCNEQEIVLKDGAPIELMGGMLWNDSPREKLLSLQKDLIGSDDFFSIVDEQRMGNFIKHEAQIHA